MRRSKILLASILFATSLHAAPYDPGGYVMERYGRVQHDESPIEGYCASACTMRLYKAKCVAPDAILAFHRATQELGTRIMISVYKPGLKAWFQKTCLDYTLHELNAKQLQRFGYKICN